MFVRHYTSLVRVRKAVLHWPPQYGRDQFKCFYSLFKHPLNIHIVETLSSQVRGRVNRLS